MCCCRSSISHKHQWDAEQRWNYYTWLFFGNYTAWWCVNLKRDRLVPTSLWHWIGILMCIATPGLRLLIIRGRYIISDVIFDNAISTYNHMSCGGAERTPVNHCKGFLLIYCWLTGNGRTFLWARWSTVVSLLPFSANSSDLGIIFTRLRHKRRRIGINVSVHKLVLNKIIPDGLTMPSCELIWIDCTHTSCIGDK